MGCGVSGDPFEIPLFTGGRHSSRVFKKNADFSQNVLLQSH